jgi:Ca2+/Na+ antiporter
VLVVSVYSLVNWLWLTLGIHQGSIYAFRNINNVFFEHFFTILIIVDVILLLFSFFHTDEFHKIIRNSGFIISTILIRLSFSVDGLLNTLLILAAIVFGLFIIKIYNKYEKTLALNQTNGSEANG